MSDVLEKIEGSQVGLFGLEGVTGVRGDCSSVFQMKDSVTQCRIWFYSNTCGLLDFVFLRLNGYFKANESLITLQNLVIKKGFQFCQI